jgi:hypothetical protein
MTDEDLTAVHREIHELKLRGMPTPREQGLANTVTQLISEIRRLHQLANDAISHLRPHNPQKADELQPLVKLAPHGPV